MKKIALTSLMAVFAVSAANAGVFDINYRPGAGQTNAQFGVAYTTGLNEDRDARTDFTSGDFGVTSVKLAHGFTDSFAVTLDTMSGIVQMQNGFFANPEIGINWRAMGDKSFGMDVIAKYGMALTEVAGTDTRIGNNNFQAGVKLFGASGDLQWGVGALAQYVFVEPNDIMNVLLTAELQYNLNSKYAIIAGLNYNFLDAAEEIVMTYDRSVSLGLIYNISDTAAVQPYVAYHLETTDENDNDFANNFVQVGAKFSVQF